MTPFPYSVDADAALNEATAMMAEHNVRHLPVTRDSAVVGILSQRELIIAVALSSESLKVADVCTDDPYIVDHTAGVDDVAETLAERHIGSAIVLHHGNLAGILTTTDICRDYVILRRQSNGPTPDEIA